MTNQQTRNNHPEFLSGLQITLPGTDVCFNLLASNIITKRQICDKNIHKLKLNFFKMREPGTFTGFEAAGKSIKAAPA
jgi:hypothetical protein